MNQSDVETIMQTTTTKVEVNTRNILALAEQSKSDILAVTKIKEQAERNATQILQMEALIEALRIQVTGLRAQMLGGGSTS